MGTPATWPFYNALRLVTDHQLAIFVTLGLISLCGVVAAAWPE